MQVEGTPFSARHSIRCELVRTIAATRIVMPASVVRLSAGRTEMNDELQRYAACGATAFSSATHC